MHSFTGNKSKIVRLMLLMRTDGMCDRYILYFKHDITVENIYIFYDRKRSIYTDLCVHIANVSFSQVLCFLSFMSFASISLHEQNNSIRFRHFVFLPETSFVQIDYNNQSKRILAIKGIFGNHFDTICT